MPGQDGFYTRMRKAVGFGMALSLLLVSAPLPISRRVSAGSNSGDVSEEQEMGQVVEAGDTEQLFLSEGSGLPVEAGTIGEEAAAGEEIQVGEPSSSGEFSGEGPFVQASPRHSGFIEGFIENVAQSVEENVGSSTEDQEDQEVQEGQEEIQAEEPRLEVQNEAQSEAQLEARTEPQTSNGTDAEIESEDKEDKEDKTDEEGTENSPVLASEPENMLEKMQTSITNTLDQAASDGLARESLDDSLDENDSLNPILKAEERILLTSDSQNVFPGDVTGDGIVSAEDISMIAMFILQKAEPTEAQRQAADVSGDGNIGNRDISMIVRILLKDGLLA